MEQSTATPAGFWRRFAAHVIDAGVFLLAAIFVGIVVGVGSVLLGIHLNTDRVPTMNQSLAQYAVSIIAAWLYFALQESGWRQATVGKRLMGIEVTDVSGARISFLRASGRYFATILSYLTFTIGFIMTAFTARKQALHDMVAGTLVVRSAVTSTALGWTLFALITLVTVGGTVAVGMFAWPYLAAQQHRAMLPPVVQAGEQAADALEAYAGRHHALPVALEDTAFLPGPGADAPLVSLDSATSRLAIAMRDGSVILVMTPMMDSTGHVTWDCRATPDETANLPARCAGE